MTTDHSDGLRTAAAAGKESAFAALSERHRRELHVHCYRMLASFDDAEDAVQETFLRAWRGRDRFDGGPLFRAWLYRIATNVCLDMLRRSSHRARRMRSFAEVPWLQPYPDRLLDEVAPSGEQPDAVVVRRETIELAFLAAMQVLPPRQRAAFIVRDVLGWPASETASLLETSVAAANSALQRARATMQEHLPAQRAEWPVPELGDEERALLEQFIDAHERCDAAAAAAIAARDIRITMPPNPYCFDGLDAIAPLLERALGPDRDGDWRLVPRGPTGCRRPQATCSGQATPSSGRSSSMCCASRTASSRKSLPSVPGCSRPSACRRRCERARATAMGRRTQQREATRRTDTRASQLRLVSCSRADRPFGCGASGSSTDRRFRADRRLLARSLQERRRRFVIRLGIGPRLSPSAVCAAAGGHYVAHW